jgi:hypothetical protein
MQTAQALDLRASVARNWSRVDAVPGPYNRLNQQLPLTATLGLDYKSADAKVSAGGSFIFKRGGVMRINTQQSSFITAKRDLDVYLLYKFTPKHALRLSIVSALAEDWLDDYTYTYTDAAGSLRRNSLAPGAAQFRAALEWKM